MEPKLNKSFSFSSKKSNNSFSLKSSHTAPSGFFSKLGPFGSSTTKSAASTPPLEPSYQAILNDIDHVQVALDHFLNSDISEAELILKPHCDDSMYYSLGYSFILYLKCVMTFQQDDIHTALGVLKHTIELAGKQRRKDGGWFDSITSWVKGTTLEDVKQMTPVERHAELVYAETYLLKALLGILYDESVMSFLRESLNIRSSYNTYMVLEKYVDYAKKTGKTDDLDDHFTSGVALGVGCFHLILSMLPASVVKVAEFIGFSSDRRHGLHVLEVVGGWDKLHEQEEDESKVTVLPAPNGLRRRMADMILIMYHIVLSKLVPLSNVDIPFAEGILNDGLKHYPRGVFFLYFNGRLMISKRLLVEAEEQYQNAIDTQKDWKQLQHMCFWELGIIYIIQQRWQKAYELYTILGEESNWSKAVYSYLKAVSLYMLANETKDEVTKAEYMSKVVGYMEQVTGKKQKIAGKSIPMEKFVARKARKFLSQGNYLLLPDLEILNAFTALDFVPLDILTKNMTRIKSAIDELSPDSKYYHDDLCLSEFLRAILSRMLYELDYNPKQMEIIHEQSLQVVFDHADNIQLDHYIYYFSRYENALMLILLHDYDEAESNIQIVLKANDRGHYGIGSGPHAKNKYSLASALVFKSHNCLTQIKVAKEKQQENKINIE